MALPLGQCCLLVQDTESVVGEMMFKSFYVIICEILYATWPVLIMAVVAALVNSFLPEVK